MITRKWLILLVTLISFNAVQAQGASLQYYSGGFAVTPYLYSTISASSIPGWYQGPPISTTYNHGTFYGQQTLQGSADASINGLGADAMNSCSWNFSWNNNGNSLGLQMYTSIQSMGLSSYSEGHTEASIRSNTESLFFKLMPGPGEQIGQPAKIGYNYEVTASGLIGMWYYNSTITKLESADSQPVSITVNGNIAWSMPSTTLPQFGDIHGLYSLKISSPIDCQIGDIIGLNFGDYLEGYGLPYTGHHEFGFGDCDLYIDLTPETSPVVPLPGTILFLGTGLGCLVIYRRRKLTKN